MAVTALASSEIVSVCYNSPGGIKLRERIKTFCYTYNGFIHLVVCLRTGPKPLPKRALHIYNGYLAKIRYVRLF